MSKKSGDNTAYALSSASRCYGCDTKQEVDEIVTLKKKADESEVYCLACSGLGDFEFLRSGNATVTRLAKKYSGRHFVVVKWSPLWKTYERQGILVGKDAAKRARQEV